MARSLTLRPFDRLQWRLMLSYMLVTVAGTVLVEGVAIGVLIHASPPPGMPPDLLAHEVAESVPQLERALESSPVDARSLERWLRKESPQDSRPQSGRKDLPAAQAALMLIADANGRVEATSPESAFPTGTPVSSVLSASDASLIHLLSQNKIEWIGMQSGRPTSQNISGVPICGAGDRIIGVVFASCNHDFSFGDLGPTIGRYLLPAASVITLFAALVGVGFGFLTARRLGNRLDLIAGAADAWSRGDFGASAPGDERDELGELARRLNQMAVELQSLLALRQEVAILQERNRLARDLHDTVKQQVFATSMQVGAARSLLDRDPEAARQRLADAEKLAGQVQRELNCILQELRPAPGEGQGLAALLRSYTGDWARQAGIPISLKIEDDLPLQIRTSQELFRVAQEALANVARHSRASGVKIQCLVDGDHVFLSVADNGCGFEVNSVLKGMGIQNMRERSESLPGGQFFVRSQPGHGAMIEARCLANRPKD